jgi:hypothetical protein
MATTPQAITQTVLTFCGQISQHSPLFVPVEPTPDANYGDCYNNVRRKVQRDGGAAMHGWCIWEEPRFFIEAEHHAVWESPQGQKVDVTPHDMGEKRILFLPDPEMVWNQTPILNRRYALKSDPKMREFLALADELDALRLSNVQPDGRYFVPLRDMMRIEARQLVLQLEMGMGIPLPQPNVAASVFGLPPSSVTRKQQKKLKKRLMRAFHRRTHR